MSHMPGVKPNFKEEWKKADRNEKMFLVLSVFILSFFTLMGAVIFKCAELDTPEKVDLMLRSLFFVVMVGVGYFLSYLKLSQLKGYEKDQRVKKGLRYSWDAEDLDELEERIRKLEEDK